MTSRTSVRKTIAEVLRDLGIEDPAWSGDTLTLRFGALPVVIAIFAHDDLLWTRITIPMLAEVQPSLALLQQLLRLNDEVLLGSFRLLEDNTLVFSHTLGAAHVKDPCWRYALTYALRVTADQLLELQANGSGSPFLASE